MFDTSKVEGKIGDRIKELRVNKNLTQCELAEKINVTDKAVSKWESGEGSPNIKSLADLANVLGTTTDYLLSGKGHESDKDADKSINNKRTNEELEKELAPTIKDGYYCIKDVIRLDDFELYEYSLTKPNCALEDMWEAYKAKNEKKLFRMAVDHGIEEISDTLILQGMEKIPNVLVSCFYPTRATDNPIKREHQACLIAPNNSLYSQSEAYYDEFHPEKYLTDFFQSKNLLQIEDIWGCNDLRFITKFIGQRSQMKVDLDALLERAIKEKPLNYELQSLLLDSGAKLHHRWIEDPGDEYERSHDDIDEVSTQLLKNQIAVLKKGGN